MERWAVLSRQEIRNIGWQDPLTASILIFLNVTVSRRTVLARFSPASWIQMQYHYRLTNTKLPMVEYIIVMRLLLTALFYMLAKIRVNAR